MFDERRAGGWCAWSCVVRQHFVLVVLVIENENENEGEDEEDDDLVVQNYPIFPNYLAIHWTRK